MNGGGLSAGDATDVPEYGRRLPGKNALRARLKPMKWREIATESDRRGKGGNDYPIEGRWCGARVRAEYCLPDQGRRPASTMKRSPPEGMPSLRSVRVSTSRSMARVIPT